MCPVSGISWHVYGAPNPLPTTSSSDLNLRLMWVREHTVCKGPRLLLAVPRGIVHTLGKAESNQGHFHTMLAVCNARIHFNTTPRNHGSTIPNLSEKKKYIHEIRSKFARNSHSEPHANTHVKFVVDANFARFSREDGSNFAKITDSIIEHKPQLTSPSCLWLAPPPLSWPSLGHFAGFLAPP